MSSGLCGISLQLSAAKLHFFYDIRKIYGQLFVDFLSFA